MVPMRGLSLKRVSLVAVALSLAACAAPSGPLVPRKETVYGVTASNKLVSFVAGQPSAMTATKPLTGLAANERLVGIDFRVARGTLFGLGSTGQLYTIDTKTGEATKVGAAATPSVLTGTNFGVDFNPTVDRIRVVSDAGLNMRMHPDTGAVVDSNADTPGVQLDGTPAFAEGDANFGKTPKLVAAGYTYNKKNEKLTTNYAIDAATGSLVTQGSREDAMPVVSPNTGRLFTVGRLDVGTFVDASFDITDRDNTALLSINTSGARDSVLYLVELATGRTYRIGAIGAGEPLVGMAIEP
ncbi:MAG TPA: DUF4394 domain-containing protein [Burkholderiaceae bacterium]|nr:DUF4394 domain-containing protein [Burkholderiaceae bacterium]